MNVEVFSFHNFIKEFSKLCLFNSAAIEVKDFPFILPECNISCFFRCDHFDNGLHHIGVLLLEENKTQMIPAIFKKMEVQIPKSHNNSVIRLPFEMKKIQFNLPGRYFFDLYVDGEAKAMLPFEVKKKMNNFLIMHKVSVFKEEILEHSF